MIEKIKPLTALELQIAQLMVQGYRKPIIAKKVNYSFGTVNNCISNIYNKIGIKYNGKERVQRIQLLEYLLSKTVRELLDEANNEKENTT